MCFTILEFIKPDFKLSGCLSKIYKTGGSVAKVIEANMSIIRLIHKIYIGYNTYYLIKSAPIKVKDIITRFNVN